jgi:hypothetical protein
VLMSVRFFKILSGVFLAHVVVLSLVWVGFSAPSPRPPAIFIYEGALPAGDSNESSEEVWQKGKVSDQLVLDHLKAAYLNHWIELRSPDKPTAGF